MDFAPEVNTKIQIDGINYQFGEHPGMKGTPFGQEGRAAMVYQLVSAGEKRALKVFKHEYRRPSLVSLADKLADFATIPGLIVCKRTVLAPGQNGSLLKQYKELIYAVSMPWIDGPTWFDILVERRALTPGQCLTIAQSLCQTLTKMEQRGLAHCDLSGPNIILHCLSQDGSLKDYPVELVDVEGFYSTQLMRPDPLISGTYPHKSTPHGDWSDLADRFAGGVILAEILGWCDERTRNYIERCEKDTFFSPNELQTDHEGYFVLLEAVRDNWGEDLAHLFEQAWNSDTLAQCPTFGEWVLALPETVEAAQPAKRTPPRDAPRSQPTPAATDEDQTIQVLMNLAQQLNEQGNHVGAIAAYRQVLGIVPADSSLHAAIETLIRTIEGSGVKPKTSVAPSAFSQELPSWTPQQLDAPLPQGEWHPVLPQESSRTRELIILGGVFALVAILLAIGALLFSTTTANNIIGQMISGLVPSVCIGLIQTWLFRKRLPGKRKLLFILPALLGGLVGGLIGGVLLSNHVLTNSLLGAIIGAIAGGVTALGQNMLMRSLSSARMWFFWNLMSWAVIFLIGWAASWNSFKNGLSGNLATAIGALTIMAITGVALTVFLRYSPEIEF